VFKVVRLILFILSGKNFFTHFLTIVSIYLTHWYLPINESLVKDCEPAGVNDSGIYGSVISIVVVSLIFVTLKGEADVLIMLLTVPSTL